MTRRKHKTIPFEFTGTVGEYFKIWIVNVGLTIVTLGIYSAWAKVRKKRYLYSNTRLQGTSFEYLGDPIKILKGRLIVGGGLIVCFVAWYFLPGLEGLLGDFTWVLFLPILPCLVMKGRTFNSRNSAYCNIRFDFRATWGEAYKVFCGLPALAVATVFLAGWVEAQTGETWMLIAFLVFPLGYPYFACRRSEFVVTHTRYGTTPFAFSGRDRLPPFYYIYFVAGLVAGMLFLAVAFLFPMTMALTGLYQYSAPFDPEEHGAGAKGGLNYLLYALVLLPVFAYVKSEVTNFVWNNIWIGDNRFESTLSPRGMIWLYVSNAVTILFSLGLLIPWTTTRALRYRLDNLKLLPGGDTDQFVARQQDKISATGEEFSDFYDVDVGL